MIKFSLSKADAKKAFFSVGQAVSPKPIVPVDGHSLLVVNKEILSLYATDKDMMGYSKISLGMDSGEISEEGISFTIDPKKVLALINDSSREVLKFSYDDATKTTGISASDNEKSYISYPSLDPESFLKFSAELGKTVDVKKVNSSVLVYGLKFIQGFVSSDSKNKKFQNAYIDKGAIYGSDGSQRIGAFVNNEFDDIDFLVIRKSMIPHIVALIEGSDSSEVIIKTTSKAVFISSPDGAFIFGYLKASPDYEPPKMPITLSKPISGGFSVDSEIFQKALKKLAITAVPKMGTEISFDGDSLKLRGLSERESVELIPCKADPELEKLVFSMDHSLLRGVIILFKSNVSMFADTKKNRLMIVNEGRLQIEEEGKDPVASPFTSYGLIAMGRVA